MENNFTDISFWTLSPYASVIYNTDGNGMMVLNWRSGYIQITDDGYCDILRAAVGYYFNVMRLVGEDFVSAAARNESRILDELNLLSRREEYREVVNEIVALAEAKEAERE